MKKTLLAIALTFAMVAPCVFADTNVGCGLGRVVMSGKSGKFADLVAWVLNEWTGTEPWAIIFGTSGYQDGATIASASIGKFVEDNMDELAFDIAAGQGEYLDTVASMLAVKNTDAFKASAHAYFDEIYSSSTVTAEEVTEKLTVLASL